MFSPTERTLASLACLSPLRPHETATLHPSLPWKQLLQGAQRGRLLPLLGWKLVQDIWRNKEERQYVHQWPKEAQKALEQAYQRSWIQAEHREHHLAPIRQTFAKHGLPFVLYKGLSYAYTLYPDPALRSMKDVDILVPGYRMQQATHLLEQTGLFARPLDPPHPCALSFTAERAAFHLDVHQRISWPHHTQIPETQLVHLADRQTSQGDRVWGPSFQVLFHLYHLCKEQLQPKHTPLRAFVELREWLVQLEDSLPSLEERAKRWGLSRILKLGLEIVEDLFPNVLQERTPKEASTMFRMARYLRYHAPDYNGPIPVTYKAVQGAFLLQMIDHPLDRWAYFGQRLQILWQQR
ncbi:MAG: hypothetical protein EP343_13465 [Deltaproteobacteria bacterium]|nr:MAG: hypothetical protein EP343_13465 [Deltaproteobacteria bacterium]